MEVRLNLTGQFAGPKEKAVQFPFLLIRNDQRHEAKLRLLRIGTVNRYDSKMLGFTRPQLFSTNPARPRTNR